MADLLYDNFVKVYKKTKFFYQHLRDTDLPHSHNSSHSRHVTM